MYPLGVLKAPCTDPLTLQSVEKSFVLPAGCLILLCTAAHEVMVDNDRRHLTAQPYESIDTCGIYIMHEYAKMRCTSMAAISSAYFLFTLLLAKCEGHISASLSLVDKNIVRPSTVAASMPQIVKNSVSGAHAKTDFEKDMTSTVSQVWFPLMCQDNVQVM
jgi:hypothetical protein